MAKKTIICFDLDGTLVNTQEAQAEAFNLALAKNNLIVPPKQKIWALFGLPSKAVIKHLFPKITQRKLKQVVDDKKNFMLKDTAKLSKPMAGVHEVLENLKKKYLLALVSNGVHAETLVILKAAGIDADIFDAIVGQDDAKPKPSPAEIYEAEKELGAKVEFIVGDSVFDILAGQAAKVKTIAVLSGAHDIKQLGAEEPTIIIKSIAILPEILEDTD